MIIGTESLLGLERGARLGALHQVVLDALHVVVLHEVAQRLPVLLLVVADARENIVKRLERRAPGGEVPVRVRVRQLLHGAERVEQIRVVLDVVLTRDVRDRHAPELLRMLLEERAVRVERVLLDELREVVRRRLRERVHRRDVPVVPKRHGLGERAVHDARVPAQRLHDEQVVQLVVRLRVVGAHAVAHPGVPCAKRFAEVHYGEVREVGPAAVLRRFFSFQNVCARIV
mmetsp:Transcript_32957/g.78087  ORF Transcript_32957/g.78087 Transcript_32957/m.78087 type:complete len:230 (+) Transcript_32957:40-729(+)